MTEFWCVLKSQLILSLYVTSSKASEQLFMTRNATMRQNQVFFKLLNVIKGHSKNEFQTYKNYQVYQAPLNGSYMI